MVFFAYNLEQRKRIFFLIIWDGGNTSQDGYTSSFFVWLKKVSKSPLVKKKVSKSLIKLNVIYYFIQNNSFIWGIFNNQSPLLTLTIASWNKINGWIHLIFHSYKYPSYVKNYRHPSYVKRI